MWALGDCASIPAPDGKPYPNLAQHALREAKVWLVRRTYYLLQMPGWSRRLRIMIEWTFALLFRPDIVKISLDGEDALLLRNAAAGQAPEAVAAERPTLNVQR